MADKPNSSSLIREAIDAGVSSPKEIAAWVKRTHGVEVNISLVNTVKHTYAKQAAPAKLGRPKMAAAEPAPVAASNGALAIEDIVAVKELVDRFGNENLSRLVEVL